jgi:predicted amidohydrolase YtcJ
MTDVLLSGARRPTADELFDLLLVDGRIESVGPSGSVDAPGAEVVPLQGRVVVPGLWDAHVHFLQQVNRRRRLDLSGTSSAAETLSIVAAQPMSDRPLVGYGFRDGLWPDAPSTAALDAVTGARPTVLISGDLHCAWMNTAACALLGTRTEADGMLREDVWMQALERLDALAPPEHADFAAAADAAAARGVVGVVDFENAPNVELWRERVEAGVRSLRVECSVWPDRLEQAIAAGRRTGDRLDPDGLLTMGRLKIIADGSLNTRTAWCFDPYPGLDPSSPHACGIETVAPSQVEQLVARAHAHGILPAVHAIGDRCNSEVLDVFERLGIPGTVEHAQLVAPADLARFGALRITASVQPEHAMDDRDVADRYWAGRTAGAFAYRSLLDAGAQLHLGSDAPVAPLDPWITLSAAVSRSRYGRAAWHPEQRLPRQEALAASVRTRIAPGEPADLVVLDTDPLTCDDEALRTMGVAATLISGRFTHDAGLR